MAEGINVLTLAEQWHIAPSAVREEAQEDVDLAMILGEAKSMYAEYQRAQSQH